MINVAKGFIKNKSIFSFPYIPTQRGCKSKHINRFRLSKVWMGLLFEPFTKTYLGFREWIVSAPLISGGVRNLSLGEPKINGYRYLVRIDKKFVRSCREGCPPPVKWGV